MTMHLGLLNFVGPEVFIDVKATDLSNDLLIISFSVIMELKELIISENIQ